MTRVILVHVEFLYTKLFESELLRKNNEKVNLSEMFIVRNAYIGKAINYLRMND